MPGQAGSQAGAAGGRGGLVGPGLHTPGARHAVQRKDGGGGGGGDQLRRDDAAGQAGVALPQQGAGAPGRW